MELFLLVRLLCVVIVIAITDARRFGGKVDTVVVLMEENVSFDRYLGWLTDVNDKGGGNHDYEDVARQIFGAEESAVPNFSQDPAPMTGFADNAKNWNGGPNMMAGYDLSAIPVSAALAKSFGICDNCFASVPGPTVPNRLFLQCGTSAGWLRWDTLDTIKGWDLRSVFNVLAEHGISWGVYFQDLPSAIELIRVRKPRWLRRFHPIGMFARHAAQGRLPRYSFIEPRYFDYPFFPGSDNSFHDVRRGEQLIKFIYESLRNSVHWERSLFIVTYDEHGGFHDHVPTPQHVPSPDGIAGQSELGPFLFDRLGVRLPVYVISPWIEAGAVIHDPINPPSPTSAFDHTMVLATLREVFGLTQEKTAFLTNRDRWAPSLLPFLNRTSPRTDCPKRLPDPGLPPPFNRDGVASSLSAHQQYLVGIALSLVQQPLTPAELKRRTSKMTVGQAGELVRPIIAKFLNLSMVWS